MKKIVLCLLLCLLLCACSKNKENVFPEPISKSVADIEKSKIEAAKISFKNIKRTAEVYYIETQLDANYVAKDIKIDFTDSYTIPDNFVFSGVIPTSGIVYIDKNGVVTLEDIVIDDLKCNYDEKENIVCK